MKVIDAKLNVPLRSVWTNKYKDVGALNTTPGIMAVYCTFGAVAVRYVGREPL